MKLQVKKLSVVDATIELTSYLESKDDVYEIIDGALNGEYRLGNNLIIMYDPSSNAFVFLFTGDEDDEDYEFFEEIKLISYKPENDKPGLFLKSHVNNLKNYVFANGDEFTKEELKLIKSAGKNTDSSKDKLINKLINELKNLLLRDLL